MTDRSRSSLVTDFSVGFVLFVATIAVIVALFAVGGPDEIFGTPAEYSLRIPSAAGLKVGSIVELRGFEAGVVSSIDLPPQTVAVDGESSSGVELTLSVSRKYTEHIRADSYAWVQTRGLLGDAVVAIGGGTVDRPSLERGGRITFKVRPLLDEIAGEEISANTAGMLGEVMELLKTLNEGKGTLGQLLKNDSLYKSIEEFSHGLTEAGVQVENLSREVTELLVAIRTHKGSLGKLITDPELYDEATSLVRRFNLLFDKDGSSGMLSTFLHDEGAAEDLTQLLQVLRRSSDKLDGVLTLLHEGRGSVGMALHDPSIAAGLRDVLVGVREADALLNLVRNAERVGREEYLKNLDYSELQDREARRMRALAAVETDASGQPVPAASQGDGRAAPALGEDE